MVAVLDTYLVGMQAVAVVLPCDESAVELVENEDQATDFLLAQAQPHLSQHLSKVIRLHVVLVGEVGDPKHRLWRESDLGDALDEHLHDFYSPSGRIHLHFPHLLPLRSLSLIISHDPTADLHVVPAEGDIIDLLLDIFVPELELLDALVLLDYLQLEDLHHVLVVVYRLRLLLHEVIYIFGGMDWFKLGRCGIIGRRR